MKEEYVSRQDIYEIVREEMYEFLSGMREIHQPFKDEMNKQMHHYFARHGVKAAMDNIGLAAEEEVRVDLSDNPDENGTKGWGEILADTRLTEKLSKDALCNMVRDTLDDVKSRVGR